MHHFYAAVRMTGKRVQHYFKIMEERREPAEVFWSPWNAETRIFKDKKSLIALSRILLDQDTPNTYYIFCLHTGKLRQSRSSRLKLWCRQARLSVCIGGSSIHTENLFPGSIIIFPPPVVGGEMLDMQTQQKSPFRCLCPSFPRDVCI